MDHCSTNTVALNSFGSSKPCPVLIELMLFKYFLHESRLFTNSGNVQPGESKTIRAVSEASAIAKRKLSQ